MNNVEYGLTVTAEEADELAQAAMDVAQHAHRISKTAHKALRFGLTDVNPTSHHMNLTDLMLELHDLEGALAVMFAQLPDDLKAHAARNRDGDVQRKIDKIHRFSQYSIERGTLDRPLLAGPD